MGIRFNSDRPDFSQCDLTRRGLIGRVAIGGGLAALLLPLAHKAAHAQATPGATSRPVRAKPNTFSLEGGQTRIDYAMTSLDGSPSFMYSGPAGEVTVYGDAITTQEVYGGGSPVGRFVTVLIGAVPDAQVITLTLVLPEINLVGDAPTPFAAFAILTTHHTTIGGPDVIEGALQTYDVMELDGTAQLLLS